MALRFQVEFLPLSINFKKENILKYLFFSDLKITYTEVKCSDRHKSQIIVKGKNYNKRKKLQSNLVIVK
jgi:hypothetical protein